MSFAGAFLTSNEKAGLFHYSISQRVVEILIDDYEETEKGRNLPWSMFSKIKDELTSEEVGNLARRYNPRLIMFNGSNPLKHEWILRSIELIKKMNIDVGISYSCHKIDENFSSSTAGYYAPKIFNASIIYKNIEKIERCIEFSNLKKEATELQVFLENKGDKAIVDLLLDHFNEFEFPVHIYNWIDEMSKEEINKIMSISLNTYFHDHTGKSINYFATRCQKCRNVVVTRHEENLMKNNLNGENCPFCGYKILYKSPLKKYNISKTFVSKKVEINWLMNIELP
ncbi:hypothetical protein [Fervidicoccus sp.]|uniref:hypothetical protein n=1 Tax=Fervidicoccus sp. TaxID=2060324 RepID=UPI003D0B062B